MRHCERMGNMKKLIVLFAGLIVLMSLMLSGCGKNQAEADIGRYHLYVSENKVFCLDAKNGTTKPIGTDRAVLAVNKAMVGEKNRILFEAKVGANGDPVRKALYLWDGKSQEATLVDTDAELIRNTEAMDCFIYIKDEAVYQYHHTRGKELICQMESLSYTSVANDFSGVLIAGTPLEQESDSRTWELWYKTADGKAQRIAQGIQPYSHIYATLDHSAVCYVKDMEEPVEGKYAQAYMWTPRGGEKQLPFIVSFMSVHGENEIYYSVMEEGKDYGKLYYYDGEQSILLYESVWWDDIDRISESISQVITYDTQTDLLLSGGKATPIPGRADPHEVESGISNDGKTVWFWQEDTWYRADLQEDGEMSVETWFLGPRRMHNVSQFVADQFVYIQDDTLYCSGQEVAQCVDGSWNMNDAGKLAYVKNGVLYCYENGQNTKMAEVGQVDTAAIYGRNAVLVEAGNIYFCKDGRKELLAENVKDVTEVRLWGMKPAGNLLVLPRYSQDYWWDEECSRVYFLMY